MSLICKGLDIKIDVRSISKGVKVAEKIAKCLELRKK